MNPLRFVHGWATYGGAIGLVGLAIYQASQQDYDKALHSLALAAAAAGLWHVGANGMSDDAPPPTLPLKGKVKGALLLALCFAGAAQAQPTVVDSFDCPGGRCPLPQRPQYRPQPQAPATVPEKAIAASVKVSIRDNHAGGSGTHLGNGLVLTNRHVAERVGNSADVMFPDGRLYGGKVVAVSRTSDLAAIHAPTAIDQAAVELGDSVPTLGMVVYSAGYPAMNGRRLHTKRGVVRGSVFESWGKSNKLDMICGSGDSGSGIFTADAKLIGVLWGGREDEGTTMCCTYVDTTSFVKEQCVTWWPGRLVGRPNPEKPQEPAQPPNPGFGPGPAPTDPAVMDAINQIRKDLAALKPLPGPPGRDGKDGTAGPTGPAGPAGKDATAGSLASIEARLAAIEKSLSQPGQPNTRVRIVPAN